MSAPGRTFGLKKMYPEKGSEISSIMDIVAIHGLDTSSEYTWAAFEKEGDKTSRLVNWLRDKEMLPNYFSDARIWAYDWNANTFSEASGQYFHQHAETFLSTLERHRRQRKDHPIIFVASCYGGLIVAKALLLASTGHSDHKHILDATVGIIFLGTPFRGSDGTAAAQTRVQVATMFGNNASNTLLSVLEKQTGILNEIRHEFVRLIRNRWKGESRIVCFYETKKTSVYKVILPQGISKMMSQILLVDSESACLDGWDRFSLEVNHSMLNKFRGSKDPNYQSVANEIYKFAQIVRIAVEKNNLNTGSAESSVPETKSGANIGAEETKSESFETQETRNPNFSSKISDDNKTKGEDSGKREATISDSQPALIPTAINEWKGKANDTKPENQGTNKKTFQSISRDKSASKSKTKTKNNQITTYDTGVANLQPSYGSQDWSEAGPSRYYSYDLPEPSPEISRSSQKSTKTRRHRDYKTQNTAPSSTRGEYTPSEDAEVIPNYSHYGSYSPVTRNVTPRPKHPAPYDSSVDSVRSSSPESSGYFYGAGYQTFTNPSTTTSMTTQGGSNNGITLAGLAAYGIVSGAAGGAVVYASTSFKGSKNAESRPMQGTADIGKELPISGSGYREERQYEEGNESDKRNEAPTPGASAYAQLSPSRLHNSTNSINAFSNSITSISTTPPTIRAYNTTNFTNTLFSSVTSTSTTIDPTGLHSNTNTMCNLQNFENSSNISAQIPSRSVPADSAVPSLPRIKYIRAPPADNGYDSLDRRYRIIKPKEQKRFWKPGRVFMILYPEEDSASQFEERRSKHGDKERKARQIETANDSDASVDYIQNNVYIKIIRFVVIDGEPEYTICHPIHTYNGQGTLRPGLQNPQHHGIIYTSAKSPREISYQSSDGEMMIENLLHHPVKVISEQKDHEGRLNEAARVNYGKFYMVDKLVRVLNIGFVSQDSMKLLLDSSRMHHGAPEAQNSGYMPLKTQEVDWRRVQNSSYAPSETQVVDWKETHNVGYMPLETQEVDQEEEDHSSQGSVDSD